MEAKKKKKHFLPFHLSKKTLKFLFRLSVVYLLFLGTLNIGFFIALPSLERAIKRALDAEDVKIGYISNVPFVFANVDSLKITINSELKLELSQVYFRYRIFPLLFGKWELVPASFSIDRAELEFHSYVLNEFLAHMKQKYPARGEKKPFNFDPAKMIFDVKARSLALTARSMTHYRVDLNLNGARTLFSRGQVEWAGSLNLQAKWSNQVSILAMDAKTSGTLAGFDNPWGAITVGVNRLNLGGLPLISEQKTNDYIRLNFSLSNGMLGFNAGGRDERGGGISPAGVRLEGDQKHFKLLIDKPFDIKYDDFEEYQALDYAFNPGKYNLTLALENSPDWNASFQISSPSHPGYGAEIGFHPRGGGVYDIPLDIKTHHFGRLSGRLSMDNRQGLLPLPSGTLNLDNVRFLLPGLAFSGNTVVKALPGKNNLDITAYDAAMNGGRMGNIRVDLGVYNGSHLIIKPLPFSNDVEVFVDVNKKVDVRLRALNLDGDFLKKNTYLAIFGLHTSTYRGDVTIVKKGRKEPVLVDGAVTGYLHGEKQIEVEMQFTNDMIVVPRLYFVGQKLLIKGGVEIASSHTNTKVIVLAEAQLGTNAMVPSLGRVIPVRADVVIQKDRVRVEGLVDQQVPFTADAEGPEVDLALNFKDYPLRKLLVAGSVSGDLLFKFTKDGWARFGFDGGLWKAGGRSLHLDFDSWGEANRMEFTRFNLGLDTEILQGLPGGYIDVSKGIGGAVRFAQSGSLQFIIGEYTWKAALDLRQYRIDDLFTIPLLQALRPLQDASTETIYADMRLAINGQISDPDIEGSISLIGDTTEKAEAEQKSPRRGRVKTDDKIENPSFQLAAENFTKTGGELRLQNLRLRHPSYNVDGNLRFSSRADGAFDADLSGAMAFLGNAVKTGLALSIKKNPENGILEYNIPNLYVLSRAPMGVSGKIFQQGSRLLFVSDNPKYGVSGYYDFYKSGHSWNILFQSDALRLTSEGRNTGNYMYGYIDGSARLKKLNLNKPINKIDGTAEIHLRAEGPMNNPLINGSIVFNDVSLSTTSLRNKLTLPSRNEIRIENNKIFIPEFTILAGAGNVFGLNGWVSLQDRSVDEMDVSFYSKSSPGGDPASLNWRLNVPFLSINGQTAIDHLKLSGGAGNINVESKILAKNLNMNLELQDLVGGGGQAAPRENFAAALLAALNLDISFTLGNGARFLNQLFDFRFEPNQEVKILGSLADNTLAVKGEIPIQSGTINYLGKDLKIDEGLLAFTGDAGDPYPVVNVSTSTTEKESQGDQVTVNVEFGGKLPNIELASLSSTPPRSRAEIYGLLGFGGNIVASSGSNNTVTSSQAAIASGVGIAENALFIAPLTQRLRRTFGFFDSLQVKTDVLGNLTRAFSLGNTVSGLALLNGSEVEIGKNIPNLNGLQVRFNMRFETPPNATVADDYLRQQYKFGLLYDYRTPSLWQMSLGISGRVTVDPPSSSATPGGVGTATTTTTEALIESTFRRSFGYARPPRPSKGPAPKEPIFE